MTSNNMDKRVFPIRTATACQLKWSWSTIYLTFGQTSSCHRSNPQPYQDSTEFNFHNIPSKLEDRQRMLQGLWPEKGCEYCKDIEDAGGQSDRITNLNFSGFRAPPELDHDLGAVSVSPRMVEIYFDNTCNLKCVYCRSGFSSLWEVENRQHGTFDKNGLVLKGEFNKNPRIEEDKEKVFQWLTEKGHTLDKFNILGGEPLYQKEFYRCLEIFEKFPMPDLDLQIFTNLNITLDRLENTITQVRSLVERKHLKQFSITASLDCWGAPQEYARFPLNLEAWQKNFEYLLEQEWILLTIGSTITPLTIATLPDLIERINRWNKKRPVYHYLNSVDDPSYMRMDIFGDLFSSMFSDALEIISKETPEQLSVRNYLEGIARQSAHRPINRNEVLKLHTFLEELDRRRSTDWTETFPWLVPAFRQILNG